MIRKRQMTQFLILFSTVLCSCSPKVGEQAADAGTRDIGVKVQALAVEHFTEGFKIDYNRDQTYACITKSFKTREKDAFATLSLLIYDGIAEQVILQETVPRATATWIDTYEVEVMVVPGMLAEDAAPPPGYIYHVKEKKKKSR